MIIEKDKSSSSISQKHDAVQDMIATSNTVNMLSSPEEHKSSKHKYDSNHNSHEADVQ